MMQVLDRAWEQYTTDQCQYLPPSANKGAEAAAELLSMCSREVQHTWLNWRRSCTLLYAASLISVSEGETLLDSIAAGRALYKTARPLLPRWFAYARSITEGALSSMKFTSNVGPPTFVWAEPREVHPRPPLPDSALQVIAKEFTRKRPGRPKVLNAPCSD
jgi:hypothetical protein